MPSRLTIGPAIGPEIEDSSMGPWPEQVREGGDPSQSWRITGGSVFGCEG